MGCDIEAFASPQERLRVFISSAQNDENGFGWTAVRKSIKSCLSECPYLNPFIIEDVVSGIPSTQLYQYQVRHSDIVVLLVKNDIRTGTAMESAVAMQHKKPMLVYFLESDAHTEKVDELRKVIQREDYCTYRKITQLNGIEYQVRTDVIQEVIRFFQYTHDISEDSNTNRMLVDLSVAEGTALSKASVPTKTALKLFDSSYKHLFGLLQIPFSDKGDTKESPLHSVGESAIDWLVAGSEFCKKENINAILTACSELYDSTKWLEKRWDSIRLALIGQYDLALKAAQEALAIAKNDKAPSWIVDDILIDCRNLEVEVHQQNNEITLENAAQSELDKLETTVYLPVLDRHFGNIFDTIAKEEIRIQTASPNAILLGSSLSSAVTDAANYFFSALLYGSYTHTIISRKVLARTLYKYSQLLDNDDLLANALELLVLQGDVSNFKSILEYNWDKVYPCVASSADRFWTLTDCALPISQASIKIAIATKLGLYFSDSVFCEVEKYLASSAPKVYWGVSEAYFDCLYQNTARLSHEKIVQMITGIIKDQRFHIGSKLSRIILLLKLERVGEKAQEEFCNALEDKLPYIVENGGTPQIIASLSSQNPSVFSKLALIPGNGLNGIEKTFYDINMGHGSWHEVLLREIATAKAEFDENNRSGAYTHHADMPFATIKNVVRNHYDSCMRNDVVEKFFPLCADILASHVSAKFKSECVDCLCDILISIPDCVLVPEELKSSISQLDPTEESNFFVLGKSGLSYRIHLAKILVGLADTNALFKWSFEFPSKETSEKNHFS